LSLQAICFQFVLTFARRLKFVFMCAHRLGSA
jgi:hypothetical protein